MSAPKVRSANRGDIMAFVGHDGRTQSFTVRKVLDEESQLLTSDLILLSERDYRAFSGMPEDQATDLALRVPDRRESATLAAKLTRRRPALRGNTERPGDAGVMIGPNDHLIAAHARSLGLVLLTGNIGEFRRVPDLTVENWLL